MSNRSKKNTLDKNENLWGWLFLLPSAAGFLIFYVFPLLFSLFLSFCQWDFASGFSNIKLAGLENYKNLTSDIWFTDSFKNSIIFTFVAVLVGTALALILAEIINKQVYFKNAFKTVMFLPYISSAVAVAIVWMVMLQPSFGPVNSFLQSIGFQNPPKWLGDLRWALPTVTMVYIWQQLGYTIIVFAAGLSGIPKDLYEAAEIDGANVVQKFFNVTVPMISPTTFFLVTMGIISSFKVFDQINVMTQGGPGTATTVLAYYIYRAAFQFYQMGAACASAWVMFILIFIVTIVQWHGQKKWVSYE